MRSKTTAALLAFFFGGLGIHKFYLGRGGQGILYMIFCWTFIPAIIACLEFFVLIFMNDHEFDMKYNPELVMGHRAPQQIAQSVTVHVPDTLRRHQHGTAGTSVVEQLSQLNELRTAGVLSDDEFIVQKQKLLGS